MTSAQRVWVAYVAYSAGDWQYLGVNVTREGAQARCVEDATPDLLRGWVWDEQAQHWYPAYRVREEEVGP